MKKKGSVNIIFLIMAIILGSAIYRLFDFENKRFEKPLLSILFAIVFVVSIFLLVKEYRKGLAD